jgi:hypothetical protein
VNDDVNDFLMGGGGPPGAKFDQVGRTWKGPILAATTSQQTTINGEPKVWKDGHPMMQAVITIQTDEHDPAVADDDGRRRLFVKGAMQQAVRDAVKAAGQKSIEIGGFLAVQYTGDGESQGPGFSPPKLYRAQYRPPAVGVDDMLAPEPLAPAPPVSAPVPPPAPVPVAAGDLF